MFLSGPKSCLDPLEEKDFAAVGRWINDPETTYFLFYGQTPWTAEQVEEHLKSLISDPRNTVFAVRNREDQSLIGFAGLYDIHPTARKAEFRILLGECRGKGIGTEVTEMLTLYGFDRLNLHRVYLGVTAENEVAVRAYENAGYVREGALREDIYRNGRYYDSVRMAILRPEYEEKYEAEWRRKYGLPSGADLG